MEEETNPFEAPTSQPGIDPELLGPRMRIRPVRMLLGWLAVYLLNLPFPLMFGLGLGSGHVWVGIVLAILVLGTAGGILCLRSDRIGMAMILGGGMVALSQMVPLLQIMAGMVALAVTSVVGLGNPGNLEGIHEPIGWAGGLLATLITGILLMKASLLLGLFVQLLTPGRWWGSS